MIALATDVNTEGSDVNDENYEIIENDDFKTVIYGDYKMDFPKNNTTDASDDFAMDMDGESEFTVVVGNVSLPVSSDGDYSYTVDGTTLISNASKLPDNDSSYACVRGNRLFLNNFTLSEEIDLSEKKAAIYIANNTNTGLNIYGVNNIVTTDYSVPAVLIENCRNVSFNGYKFAADDEAVGTLNIDAQMNGIYVNNGIASFNDGNYNITSTKGKGIYVYYELTSEDKNKQFAIFPSVGLYKGSYNVRTLEDTAFELYNCQAEFKKGDFKLYSRDKFGLDHECEYVKGSSDGKQSINFAYVTGANSLDVYGGKYAMESMYREESVLGVMTVTSIGGYKLFFGNLPDGEGAEEHTSSKSYFDENLVKSKYVSLKLGHFVYFDSLGVLPERLEAQILFDNEKAKEPVFEVPEGYKYYGCYTDYDCTDEFDFDTPITSDMWLYLKIRGTVEHSIKLEVDGKGTASLSADKSLAGETIFIDCKPDNGEILISLKYSVESDGYKNETDISDLRYYNFTMPNDNVKVVARFSGSNTPKPTPTPTTSPSPSPDPGIDPSGKIYNVVIKEVEGGTVTADHVTSRVNETIKLSAETKEGYEFKGFNVYKATDDKIVLVQNGAFVMPNDDVVVVGDFRLVEPDPNSVVERELQLFVKQKCDISSKYSDLIALYKQKNATTKFRYRLGNSADKKLASVNGKGVINPKKAGRVVILFEKKAKGEKWKTIGKLSAQIYGTSFNTTDNKGLKTIITKKDSVSCNSFLALTDGYNKFNLEKSLEILEGNHQNIKWLVTGKSLRLDENDNLVVLGNGASTVKLYYTDDKGQAGYSLFKVSVKLPVFAKATYMIKPGKALKLKVKNTVKNINIVKSFESDNELIKIIDGKVVADIGTPIGTKAIITAHMTDGQDITCEVVVN